MGRREAVRVDCDCRCGMWWYSPPANGNRRYFNDEHKYRAHLMLGRNGEHRHCKNEECPRVFVTFSKVGRPPEYCSMNCRRRAKARRAAA